MNHIVQPKGNLQNTLMKSRNVKKIIIEDSMKKPTMEKKLAIQNEIMKCLSNRAMVQ